MDFIVDLLLTDTMSVIASLLGIVTLGVVGVMIVRLMFSA